MLKPLFTEEDCLRDEADIYAAVKALEAAAAAPPPAPVRQAADAGADPFEAPTVIRVAFVQGKRRDRFLAALGARSRAARTDLLNRIARTVEFSNVKNLHAQAEARRTRAFSMVQGLYGQSRDPETGLAELASILGWIQALVVMTCSGVTARDVRAL